MEMAAVISFDTPRAWRGSGVGSVEVIVEGRSRKRTT